jgi:hypothetical protein
LGSIVLGHDHDPQRLDTTTRPTKIGGVAGHHRHGWLLLLKLLQCDIRPSTAQHIHHLALINAIVRHKYQRHVVAARYAGAAHVAPGSSVPRHLVSHITHPTAQSPHTIT